MGDISIAAAGRLVLRTFPFMLLRAAVYFGIAAAFAVAVGGGAGIGAGLGSLAGPAGRAPGSFWGAAGGFAFIALLLWWLREYLLYLVEIGHAAAMALALDRVPPPPRQGRIAAAMTAVQRRFREAETLSAAERLVRGTLGNMIAAFDTLASLLPPGIEPPRNLSDPALRASFGFVGKAVLARTVRRTARNPYSDLQDSLILLAQNHAVLLRNAALLAAAAHAATFAVFLLSLIPAFELARAYPGGSGLIAVSLAAVFAWCFRRAAIEPFAVAAFLELYWRATGGQEPEPDWDAKLAEISGPYREVKAVAAPAIRGQRRGIVV